MIVLSILAALGVNEWQEAQKRGRQASDARAAFIHEIRANRDLLVSDDYLPHHRRLQKQYQQAADTAAPDPGAFFETGVHPAPLRDAAWGMLSGSAILMELPSDLVLMLSEIYRAQDSLKLGNQGFLTALATPRSDRETPAFARDVTRSISLYLNDVVPAEEALVRNYDHALEKLAR